MSEALVAALRANSFDVETAKELKRRAISDIDHLRYATSVGRVLYSFNRRDYLRLHGELLSGASLTRG